MCPPFVEDDSKLINERFQVGFSGAQDGACVALCVKNTGPQCSEDKEAGKRRRCSQLHQRQMHWPQAPRSTRKCKSKKAHDFSAEKKTATAALHERTRYSMHAHTHT